MTRLTLGVPVNAFIMKALIKSRNVFGLPFQHQHPHKSLAVRIPSLNITIYRLWHNICSLKCLDIEFCIFVANMIM